MNNAMKLVLPKLGMLAAALVLAGCSLAPTYKVPETPTASTFKEADAAAAKARSGRPRRRPKASIAANGGRSSAMPISIA
jgi:outer membrane protein TolC